MITNILITLVFVLALFIFSKTMLFYKIYKRIALFFYLRIPCHYVLIETKDENGKIYQFIGGVYQNPITNNIGRFLIPRELFKKWYPEILKQIESQMVEFKAEEYEEH